jgi:hypothetical protein
VQLAFSGGLAGNVTKAINVLPIKTGAHYDYNQPPWATQCLFPADDDAWSADVSFQLNGITWQISIGQPGFGLAKPGSHPALPENLTGGSADDPNAVSISVTSNQSPDGNSSADANEYTYYTPPDHNNGAGTVTIEQGLTSGTVDIWLTPSQPDALMFHITGRWSCRP